MAIEPAVSPGRDERAVLRGPPLAERLFEELGVEWDRSSTGRHARIIAGGWSSLATRWQLN